MLYRNAKIRVGLPFLLLPYVLQPVRRAHWEHQGVITTIIAEGRST
jgi:hypothetical protein